MTALAPRTVKMPDTREALGAPLFTVEDVSQVKVDVRVPEAEMEGLAEGGNARVELLGQQIEARMPPDAAPPLIKVRTIDNLG